MRRKDGSKKVPATPETYEKPSDHPACGMWKDREDMKDPVAYIRKMREPRYTWDDVLGVVRTQQ
ncbi:MAG TPA: hypothetical protein VK752_14075 [Bryobacteraceae bacterium]|nr:hypothetical protein [Bryobacteraceae bacterium]